MGERLKFKATTVTPSQARDGSTAYEATAEGVTYRIIGTPTRHGGAARTFHAFRGVGDGTGKVVAAGQGGEHRTKASAAQQCEADLDDVLRDRAAAADRVPVRVSAVEILPGGERAPVGRGPRETTISRGALDSLTADPATTDDTQELMDRVIRRAQYLALRAMLDELNRRALSFRAACQEVGHGSASSHDDGLSCGEGFSVAEMREMVNDAARALGTAQPYRVAP